MSSKAYLRIPLTLVLALAASAHASAPDAGSPHSPILARVGSAAITTAEVDLLLSHITAEQRALIGGDLATLRRRIVEEVIAPEVRLALAASDAKLGEKRSVASIVDRARANATIDALRDRSPTPESIPIDAARAYFEANRAKYEIADRVAISRIRCKTRGDAEQVLAAATKNPSTENFASLARKYSTDQTTLLRDGNLGFVDASGGSTEQGVHVDPAIVKAAWGVEDGEFAPHVVPEDGGYSVVWKRATAPGVRRSFEDALPEIRQAIAKERFAQGRKDLIAELRKKSLTTYNEALLKTLDVAPDAKVIAPSRPGQVPSSAP